MEYFLLVAVKVRRIYQMLLLKRVELRLEHLNRLLLVK
jgi:hypothetical protein